MTDIIHEARTWIDAGGLTPTDRVRPFADRFAQAVIDLSARAEKAEQRIAELEAALRAANEDLLRFDQPRGW